MKVITKMTGLRLLEEIVNNNLSCGTIIRHKREDVALMSNPPQPVYEYYKYTAGDKRFHRCNENGKLGAKGQPSFMNYQTLYKEFVIKEEDIEIEELNLDADALKGDEIVRTIDYLLEGKINSLVKAITELRKELKKGK